MKKKVLHLRSSGALLGAENVILELARNSEEYGYYSFLGALKDTRDPSPQFLDVAGKFGLQTVVFENRRVLDFDCASKLRRYIKNNRIDVLHCHGYKEDFFGVLSRCGIVKIATNHLWKNTSTKLKAYRLLDIFLLRCFDRVVGVSGELVAEMEGLGIRNVSKIVNGIDVNRFSVSCKSLRLFEQFAIPSGAVILGMVSSLTPEKNHRIVIECLAKLVDFNLVLLIVGNGVQEDSLRALVTKRGLDAQVIFAGRQENIPEILSIVDIYLLPSLAEGLPMSLLEAMACGRAVIASRVGENEQVITHSKNGLLVTAGSMSELLKSIKLLMEDTELRSALGQKARSTVEGHFSSILMTQAYCQLYDSLLSDAPDSGDGGQQ